MWVQTASTSAASIALPTMGEKLHIVEYKLQWILSAYALSSVCYSIVICSTCKLNHYGVLRDACFFYWAD